MPKVADKNLRKKWKKGESERKKGILNWAKGIKFDLKLESYVI